MIKGQKVVVVLPAYNAARTLEQTLIEIPRIDTGATGISLRLLELTS